VQASWVVVTPVSRLADPFEALTGTVVSGRSGHTTWVTGVDDTVDAGTDEVVGPTDVVVALAVELVVAMVVDGVAAFLLLLHPAIKSRAAPITNHRRRIGSSSRRRAAHEGQLVRSGHRSRTEE
jgi:hypothetical protein